MSLHTCHQTHVTQQDTSHAKRHRSRNRTRHTHATHTPHTRHTHATHTPHTRHTHAGRYATHMHVYVRCGLLFDMCVMCLVACVWGVSLRVAQPHTTHTACTQHDTTHTCTHIQRSPFTYIKSTGPSLVFQRARTRHATRHSTHQAHQTDKTHITLHSR